MSRSTDNRAYRTFPSLAALCVVASCAAPLGRPDVSVRHFASTESAGNGARWHIFLFDPRENRSLDDRISLARANLDPGCRWIGAPRDQIVERTAAQGTRYADTVLAAPLICQG